MRLRVAAAQMCVSNSVEANYTAIRAAIDYAARERADILLTPEGSLSGYTHLFDPATVRAALSEIKRKAGSAGMGLALGTCFVEPADGLCYNQIRFYDASGSFLGFHSKTLTCGSLEEPPRGEIEHFAVSPLRTFRLNGAQVAGLICNDLWANPQCTPHPDLHLTQRVADLGARIVFHAVNGGRDGSERSEVAWKYHEANLLMRAEAGRLWIVTVDNCSPTSVPCSSPSGVVTPDGRWALRAPASGEHLFCCNLDLTP